MTTNHCEHFARTPASPLFRGIVTPEGPPQSGLHARNLHAKSFCGGAKSISSGTSVDQIERFYARNLPLSKEMAINLQSFGGWNQRR